MTSFWSREMLRTTNMNVLIFFQCEEEYKIVLSIFIYLGLRECSVLYFRSKCTQNMDTFRQVPSIRNFISGFSVQNVSTISIVENNVCAVLTSACLLEYLTCSVESKSL